MWSSSVVLVMIFKKIISLFKFIRKGNLRKFLSTWNALIKINKRHQIVKVFKYWHDFILLIIIYFRFNNMYIILHCKYLNNYVYTCYINYRAFPTRCSSYRRKNSYESCYVIFKHRINTIKLYHALYTSIQFFSEKLYPSILLTNES